MVIYLPIRRNAASAASCRPDTTTGSLGSTRRLWLIMLTTSPFAAAPEWGSSDGDDEGADDTARSEVNEAEPRIARLLSRARKTRVVPVRLASRHRTRRWRAASAACEGNSRA